MLDRARGASRSARPLPRRGARLARLALRGRHQRRGRPADGVRARLRQLARGAATGRSRRRATTPIDRVRQPDGRARRDRAARSSPGSRRGGRPGSPRWVRGSLHSGSFLGTLAQIPLGGLTVIFDLHPLLVMAHFLLALVVLALAVVVVRRGLERAARPRRSARAALVAPVRARSASSRASSWSSPARSSARRARTPAEEDIRAARRRGRRRRLRPRPRDRGLRRRLAVGGWFLVRNRRRYPGLLRLGARAARAAARADGGRRDPVPERPAVVARARPRRARGGDLGADGGARLRAPGARPRRSPHGE